METIKLGQIWATVNCDTGFTANMMVLGHEVNVPSYIVFGVTGTNRKEMDAAKQVKELLRVLQETWKKACEELQSTQICQKRSYDTRCYQTRYNRGALVYKCDDSTRIGYSKKLRPIWISPYIVEEVLSPA